MLQRANMVWRRTGSLSANGASFPASGEAHTMKIDGSFSIQASIDRVWSLITDPKCFAPCGPGCDDIEVLGPDQYQASVKVSFGPIKTTFVVVFAVVEQEAPVFWKLRVRGEEGGKASSLSAD